MRQFGIPDSVRTQHVYIAGKTRHGKSTLIHWSALQDIDGDKGVAVLDPKGDLVERLIHHIPKKRVADTIYLDGMTPIPIDFMSWATYAEKTQLADDLMVTFKQLSQNAAGDRWQSILQWTVNTILEARACSFLDIYYFLVSEDKRRSILKRIRNDEILQYWKEQFPHLPKDSATPITTRMAKFLLTPSLKAMLGSPDAKLNIFDLMESKKVLLVNLNKVGKESGNLLGTLLVSKFQQAALRRECQMPKDRIPFYLYADEFQNFQTSAFDVILSEAGGFQLCLTLAHQYVDQLDPRIRASIFGNVSSWILFRLGWQEAVLFKSEIPSMATEQVWKRNPCSDGMEWMSRPLPFDPASLTSLPRGRALYRAADGTAHFINTPPPPGPSKASCAEIIRKRTLDEYACQPPKEPVASKEDEPKPTGRPKAISPNDS